MTIDVHAHLFSPAYIQGLQRIFGNDNTPMGQDAQRLIRWMSSDPRMIDVEGRLEEMAKWDIDMQILSVPFHGALVQDRAAATELAQVANDVVVQAAHNHPDRFRVLLAVPLQFPELAVNELDRFAGRPEVAAGTRLHAGAEPRQYRGVHVRDHACGRAPRLCRCLRAIPRTTDDLSSPGRPCAVSDGPAAMGLRAIPGVQRAD
jgi:predicted TIM-barrel fold metal-dependent hydrolase